MAKVLLSQKLVNEATCSNGRPRDDLFDTGCKGLMLEVRKSGGKTYYLRYCNSRGEVKHYKLACAEDVSLVQARALADKARNKVAMGIDPCEEKAALKAVPTFDSFVLDHYMPYVKSYKRSWDTDDSLLRNHLLPRFGNKHLDEITRGDILKLVQDRLASGAKPGTANRVLILMRYAFNLALRWETQGVKSNPTKGVPLLAENNKRERYLTNEETQRLFKAVCDSPNPMLRFIMPMLILTGARKREVLDARWGDFDLVRRVWRIPMSKSGHARHVPLSDGVLHLLESVPRFSETDHVFPNPKTFKPFVSIFCSWNTARKSAGLEDVRIHDLRHSFASLLINNGRTLYEVQKILGHTQVKTTQRYAHLSQDTLRDAANAAAMSVANVLMPSLSSPSAVVIQSGDTATPLLAA